MRRTIAIPALGLLMITLGAPQAATNVGVRVGYYFDADAISLGTEMLSPLNDQARWYFNPNVQLAMSDFRDEVSLNADFHYDFQPYSDLAVWAGAGPALYFIDRGAGRDDDARPAANAIFGLGSNNGNVRPFAQFKGVLMSDPEAVLEFGLRF